MRNMTSEKITMNVTEKNTLPKGCLISPSSNFTPWNNPEDLVSSATRQMFNEIVNVYMLILLFFLSVPLNVINMVVFKKHGLKKRINLCLFFLSLEDAFLITFHLLRKDRFYSTLTNKPYKSDVFKFVAKNKLLSLESLVYTSGFMSTLIALERCLCVVSPLKAQEMLQAKATLMIVVFSHVAIYGAHYIIITRWDVRCLYDPQTGLSADAYYPTEFYFQNKELVDVFDGIIFGILLPGLYMMGVSVSTVVTVIKLRQMEQWRHQSSSVSTDSTIKDVALTQMLIGTSVLFMLCTAPAFIFRTVIPFVPELNLTGKYYNTLYLLFHVQQLCSNINSSFNFFVYYSFGTKFRTTVRCMFGCCSHSPVKSGGDLQLPTVAPGVKS